MAGDTHLVLPPPPVPGPMLAACSGGLDSIALLHLLAGDAAARRRGLRAIHVDHGLHPQSPAWARHCADTCRGLGIELTVAEVQVARDGGDGLEAAARAARHGAFAQALAPGEVLVLGHHLDDQAETFLLRALRASGVDGLAAMRSWRRFARGWMWRPLLDTPRAQLLAYARARRLRWVDDPSNDSEVHARNFLRHQVLPLLRTRWPQADAALAQAASLQAEAAALLASEDAQALARVRTIDPRCLHASAFATLPPARRARVLRRWVESTGLPPLPAQGVARVAALLRADGHGEFAWQGAVVRRWRDLLWAGPALSPTPPGRVEWDGMAPLAWNGGELVLEPPCRAEEDFDTIAPPFVVHTRTGGERITLPGRRHSHALKHVLQDLGIPPWVRERLPLLSDRAGTVLAAGDVALSAGFDAWLRATGRQLRWDRPA